MKLETADRAAALRKRATAEGRPLTQEERSIVQVALAELDDALRIVIEETGPPPRKMPRQVGTKRRKSQR